MLDRTFYIFDFQNNILCIIIIKYLIMNTNNMLNINNNNTLILFTPFVHKYS